MLDVKKGFAPKRSIDFNDFVRDLGCLKAKRSPTKTEIQTGRFSVEDIFPPVFREGMKPNGDPPAPENFKSTPIFPQELNNDFMNHELAQNSYTRLQCTGEDAIPEEGILNRLWVVTSLVEAEDDLKEISRIRHNLQR